jgi:hypothetical protein
MKRGNYLERTYNTPAAYNTPGLASGNACVGTMATPAPPREVAFSVLSDIENAIQNGVSLATRVADSLGGFANDLGPGSALLAKDAPMDMLTKLVQLRSAISVLNHELNRTANALGV